VWDEPLIWLAGLCIAACVALRVLTRWRMAERSVGVALMLLAVVLSVRALFDRPVRVVVVDTSPAGLSSKPMFPAIVGCIVLTEGTPNNDVAGWSPTCDQGIAGGDGVERLISRALRHLEERSRFTRALDAALGVDLRVVVVATSTTNASKIQHERLAELVSRARELGARLDWVDPSDAAGAAQAARLEIVPRTPRVMSLQGYASRYAFDVEVRGSSFGPISRVDCVFDGECVVDGDCGHEGQTCSAGRCEACAPTCVGDQQCRAGVCVPAGRAKPSILSRSDVIMTPLRGGSSLGGFELADFRDLPSELDPGWYALTCIARTASGTTLRASRYVEVESAEFRVHWGTGQRLGNLESNYVPAQEQLYRTNKGSLTFGGHVLDREGRLLLSEKVKVALVHDASDGFWETHCPKLTQWVEAGGALIVSAAPAREGLCPLLPVRARALPEGQSDGLTAVVHLRPRVTFLLDLSRIGRMTYGPSPDGLEQTATVSDRRLLEGLHEVQLPFVGVVERAFAIEREGCEVPQSAPDQTNSQPVVCATTSPAAEREEPVGLSWTEMTDASAVRRRLRAFRDARDKREVWPNEVVVLFAYVPQVDRERGTPEVLGEVLTSGSQVVLVPIAHPFVQDPKGAIVRDVLASSRPQPSPGRGPFASEPRVLERASVLTATGLVPWNRWQGGAAIDLTAKDAGAGVERVARMLARDLEGRFSGHYAARIVSPNRFVGATEISAVESAPMPLRVQLLSVDPHASVVEEVLHVSGRPASSDLDLGPMAVASVVGQGHVLVVGSSVVDGIGEVPLGAKDEPRPRVFGPGPTPPATPLGTQLVNRFAERLDGLSQLASSEASVRSIRVEEGRHLILDVAASASDATLQAHRLVATVVEPLGDKDAREEAVRACRALPPQESPLPLSAFDPLIQRASYLIPRVTRGRLCGQAACSIVLCQVDCSSSNTTDCQPRPATSLIYLQPLEGESEALLSDLSAEQRLSWLAMMTGGSRAQAVTALVARRPRPSMWLALSPWLVALYFLVRLPVRALRERATFRREMPAKDPSRGSLRGEAESLGVPLPNVPAGAFGSARTIEPGDGARSLDRGGLARALLTFPGQMVAPPLSVLRIDTSPRAVTVVVDAGSSMMQPSPGAGPKMSAAERVALFVGQVVRVMNGQLVVACGLHATTSPAPADPEISSVFAAHTPRTASSSSLPLDVDTEVLIFVSDFMVTDLGQLSKDIDRFQGDGGVVGLILIWSEAECLATHFGRAGSGGSIQDRTGLDPADLRVVLKHRHDAFRRAAASARAGSLVLQAEASDAVLALTVVESPLLEAIR
jgi:hypothetical protein